MAWKIGDDVRLKGASAKIRDIKDDKALCEWIDGTEQKSAWFSLDLLPAPAKAMAVNMFDLANQQSNEPHWTSRERWSGEG